VKLDRLDVVLNFCAIYHCAPSWSLDAKWADGLIDYDLWYVWGGLGKMTLSDGAIDLYPGQCVWMRPGRHYEANHDPRTPLRVTALHFQLKNKTRLLRPAEYIPPVEVFEPVDSIYFQSAMAHIVGLRSRPGLSKVAALLLKSLLIEIVLEQQGQKPGNAQNRHYQLKLGPVIAAIREQPERWFTVNELALRSGYCVDHFVRLFRSLTGQAPKEFMIRQRMEKATALLKGSSHTVTQIADMLGYQDLGFFSRQFQQIMGTSPVHFRHRRNFK